MSIRRPHGGRLAGLAALLACLGASPGCCLFVPRADAAAILASGFDSPEQTVRTLITALREDLAVLEYRCLSDDFRRRNRLSLATWLEARDALRRREPLLALAGRMELTGEGVRVAEGVHRLEVRVLGRRAEILLVRQDYFEMYGPGGVLAGGPVDWDDALETPADPAAGGAVRARVPWDPDEQGPVDPADGTRLVLGREWKIDAFRELPAP